MTKKTPTIEEKTREMIKNGLLLHEDFDEMIEWVDSDAVDRDLSQEEIDALREKARQQIANHQKNKL